jgi:NAD(P)-dependent dehydrogenase (short-subunit alcohol dehydrogenase family)
VVPPSLFRFDHTAEKEVEEVFERVVRERGRLDILVNSIAGEDPLMAQWRLFGSRSSPTSSPPSTRLHIMIRNRSGLIVEVTENDILSAGGNPVTQAVKFALKGLALNMAAELRLYGVSAVAITPGFLRSETMLERLGITEENWREGKERQELSGIRIPTICRTSCCRARRRSCDTRAIRTAIELLAGP